MLYRCPTYAAQPKYDVILSELTGGLPRLLPGSRRVQLSGPFDRGHDDQLPSRHRSRRRDQPVAQPAAVQDQEL